MTAASLPTMAGTRRKLVRGLCWVAAISTYTAGCLLLTAAALLGGFR